MQILEVLLQYMVPGSSHVISLGNVKYVILDKHLSCSRLKFFDILIIISPNNSVKISIFSNTLLKIMFI